MPEKPCSSNTLSSAFRRRAHLRYRSAPPRTWAWSASRYSCSGASSGSCRRARARSEARDARRGKRDSRAASAEARRACCHERCGQAPGWRASRGGRRSAPPGNFRQWAISLGVGLLAGGTQRTALVIMQSVSVSAFGRARIVSPAGEPDLEQSAIEQLAGIVTEEGTPGAIGALQSRREPDDEEPRAVGPEGRNRAVEPIGMRGSLVARKETSRGQSGQSG